MPNEKENELLAQIEKDARTVYDAIGRPDDGNECRAWIAGAISQNNKVIEAITKRIKSPNLSFKDKTIGVKTVIQILESLKITDK